MECAVDNIKVNISEKIFAFLFALFFVAQILSPSINHKTIYLEWLVMAVNPYFWRWLLPVKINERKIYICLLLMMIGILGHPLTAMKIVMNIYSAMALVYLWRKRIWYINFFIYISILVSVLQLAFFAVDVNLAMMIGPQNISSLVWGSYATETFTNLYDAMGIGIPRASGLSREAGFLASLLAVAILHRIIDQYTEKSSLLTRFVYVVGYITSFSKMSLVIVPAYIVTKLSRYINKVFSVFWIGLFFVLMLIFWNGETEFLNDTVNITYLSRFGAYDSIWYLDCMQLILGEDNLSKIGGISAINEYYGENSFAGLGGWVITNGLLVLLLFVLLLKFMQINPIGAMLLLLLTVNVQPDTNQNFVVYTWFLCIEYYRNTSYKI